MVLKKSNSPFNSGATQRGFKGGTYMTINEPSQLTLSFTLRGLPRIYDEKNPSSEHEKALKKIYDYLGFSGPSLKTFLRSRFNIWDHTIKGLSFSLNKQELWRIRERFEMLMKEKNLLDGEGGFAEIRVTKVKWIADRETIHSKQTFVINPEVEKDSKPPTKRKAKGKNRGIQRSHIFRRRRTEAEDGDDDEWVEKPRKKSVEVELLEEDQVDARILNFRSNDIDYQKRKVKAKSCVNGKNAFLFRRYNPQELKKETENVILKMSKFDEMWEDDDYYRYHDEDNTTAINNDEDRHNIRGEIGDYNNLIISTEREITETKHKKVRRRGNIEADSSLVYVNPASSKTTLRHEKGSFHFIEKPSYVVDKTENTTLSEEGVVDVNTDEVTNIDSINGLNIDIDETEIHGTLATFDSSDNFVELDLQFPEGVQKEMVDSILQSNYTFSIDRQQIMLGNCFPPVFSINLENEQSSFYNEWSLIATSSSDVFSVEELKWEINLKTVKQSCVDDKVKNIFSRNLKSLNTCAPQFYDLVKVALSSIQCVSTKGSNDTVVSVQRPSGKNCGKDLFSYLNCDNALRPKVCSMEDAVKTLRANQLDETQRLESTTKNRLIKISSDSVECDVCFDSCNTHGPKDHGIITLLPCSHSFCFECWRSHIFYHLKSGYSEIRCMHTDCTGVLNETMMKAFVPESYLTKMYLQKQEKCIERSPLTQWCPQAKCNKVAMIADINPHVQQFGCRVVCECQSSWCFSCQSKPHWPVSCSQAAAYRNLLYSLGDEMPKDVTCNVELKPCPGCKYPIEKNEGCPHMICRMCDYNFCWTCLRHPDSHMIFYCTADENSTFVTYELYNDVVNSFPLKFFRDSLDMKKRYKSLRKDNVRGWLIGLNYCKKVNLPFQRSVQLEEAETVKNSVVHSASESINFLEQSFIFLEYFYLLFSFALLNEEKENRDAFYSSTQRVIDRLMFTTTRLENSVVGKSLKQLLFVESTTQMFLENGRELMEKLKNRVTSFQRLSKDVIAEPIGKLDPKSYYRYK